MNIMGGCRKRRGNSAATFRSTLLASIGLLALVAPPVMAQENLSGAHPKSSALTPAQSTALDAWTYSLALQVANWGAPLVTMYDMRYLDAVGPAPKASPNSIWRMENTSTPALSKESGYVTPNVNVVYGFGFMDLGPEPIILSVPDSKGPLLCRRDRRHVQQRLCLCGRQDDRLRGREIRAGRAGLEGQLPAGVTRIDCPTRWILVATPRPPLSRRPAGSRQSETSSRRDHHHRARRFRGQDPDQGANL